LALVVAGNEPIGYDLDVAQHAAAARADNLGEPPRGHTTKRQCRMRLSCLRAGKTATISLPLGLGTGGSGGSIDGPRNQEMIHWIAH